MVENLFKNTSLSFSIKLYNILQVFNRAHQS